MDDLTKRQAEITAEVWRRIESLDRRLGTLRNALQMVGPGESATMVAGIVADEANGLLLATAKADGFGDAVSRM